MRPKVPIPQRSLSPRGPYFPPSPPLKHRACHPPTTSTVSPTQIIASAHSSRAYPKPNILQYHALSSITNPHTCLSPKIPPPKHIYPASITLLSSFMPSPIKTLFHIHHTNTLHQIPSSTRALTASFTKAPSQYHERPQAR